MGERKVVLFIVILISVVSLIHCVLEIIPERAGVDYLNQKYVQNAKVYIRKNGRRGLYVAHIDFTINATLANNVTMHLIFYEYLHNEYRRSFVEIHMKLCDLIEKDQFIGLAIRNLIHCPVVPNEYQLHNLSLALPEVEKMKWVFPFEKTKVQAIFQLTHPVNVTLAEAHMMVTVRQIQKKPKSN